MKLKIFCILTLMCNALLFSQIVDSAAVNRSLQGSRNIIKTNATAYSFRNVNLTYERVISKTTSLAATYSFMPSGKVPFIKAVLNEDDLGEVENINMSYNSFTLEPRLYLNKNGYGRGFYLSPYYRHSRIEFSEYRYLFQSEVMGLPVELPVDLSGTVSGNSFGLMIGNQWLLGEKENWVLDLSMLGGHYGFSNGDLLAVSDQKLTPQMQEDLQKELDELDVPLVNIKATANENGATAKVDGPWAGLRFGLSIGYRF